MALRRLEITAGPGLTDTIVALAEQHGALECRVSAAEEDGRRTVHLLVGPSARQKIMDMLQTALGGSDNWRVVMLPVETTRPKTDDEEAERRSVTATREELYDDVAAGAEPNWNFLLFVLLSTVVAAIGLVADNVAVVIGAMVIAPLLGPNLAQALGAVLGDRRLMLRAVASNFGGLLIAFAISAVMGVLWQPGLTSGELMARTAVGLDGIAIALASGAAGVLSLTTGIPSALVGVMVAVALLPPAATAGLMVGMGEFGLAGGAGLLLAVNIACVNLAGQIVFLARGVRPRTWLEKRSARQSALISAFAWLGLLAALALLIVFGVVFSGER